MTIRIVSDIKDLTVVELETLCLEWGIDPSVTYVQRNAIFDRRYNYSFRLKGKYDRYTKQVGAYGNFAPLT